MSLVRGLFREAVVSLVRGLFREAVTSLARAALASGPVRSAATPGTAASVRVTPIAAEQSRRARAPRAVKCRLLHGTSCSVPGSSTCPRLITVCY